MVNTRSSQCGNKMTLPRKAKPNHCSTVRSSSRNMKPLVEERNYFTASVRMLSSFRVIDNIKKKLTRRQAELFGKTCFRQFLKLRQLRFSGQLVHHILLRQLACPDEAADSMSFRIGGKECEFGLGDFALITGLDCSEYVSPDAIAGKLSNRVRDKYFRGSDKVLFEAVARAFKMYQGNSDDDAVKLAQLYLLEGFLLSKEPMVACHNFFIQLVDNADEFNRFPWGRYAYEYTVESMRRAVLAQVEKLGRKRKRDGSNGHYDTSYFLRGFPHALQFWAFECIPLIGEKFGNKIYGKTPRMLNWALGEKLMIERLRSEVFNGDEFQVERGLEPTESEMREDYFRYFLGKQNLKKSKKSGIGGEDKSPEEQAKETVTKGKFYEKSENGSEIHVNEEDGDDTGQKYNDTTPRKAQIEDENDWHLMRKEIRTIREEVNAAFSALREEMRASIKTEIAKQRSNVAAETDLDVISLRVDEDDSRDECVVQGADEIPCFTVDLFEHPDRDEKAEFDEWIEVGRKRNNKRNKYIDASNKLQPGFDFTILKCDKKDWFFSLNETAQWLSSSHIDVALYFMRKKKKDHPDLFKHRCTTTDSLFCLRLSMIYSKFRRDPEGFLWDKEALIQKTVEGLEPHDSLPWVDVDVIYIPVNANKKHWVVAALDLRERRLHVYDSCHSAKRDKQVMSMCRPIAEMVPWILVSGGFFDARNDFHTPNDATAPLDVKLVQGVPQQGNGGDCGMFMLKFTEFLMQDAPLEKCNQQEISFFRNKMAVELYAYAKKRMAKE